MNAQHGPAPRLKSLDLLRLGLCLLVMATHARRIFGISFPYWLTKGVFDAKGAVVLFFVLSGYVLTKSLARGPVSWLAYWHFIVRRAFRLFPMYWAGLLVTLAVLFWLKTSGLGPWGADNVEFLRQDGLGWHQWLLHFALLIPGMQADFALPTVWSLMTESKISLLAFPHLGWAALRLPRWGAVGMAAIFVLGSDFFFHNVVGTAAYLGMFSIGAVLARVPEGWWNRIPAVGWGGMLTLGAVLYSCMSLRYSMPSVWMGYYLCAIGSGMIITCVSNWLLLSKPMHALYSKMLGVDLSYGIYILHYPLLVAFFKFGEGFAAAHPVVSALVAMSATVALAWGLALAVEIPMIKLGRKLAGGPPAKDVNA